MRRIAAIAALLVMRAAAQYTVSTIAGGGFPNNAPALSVSFTPRSVVEGPGGILYIADQTTVYKLTAAGNISVYSSPFSGIGAMAVDAAGNVYVLETNNNRIQEIVAGVGTVRTFAGGGSSTQDGALATQTQIQGAAGIAVDDAGNIFISESWGERVRRVDAAKGTIKTIAGTGTAGYSGDGGPALQAQFNGPAALAADAAGNLYVFEAFGYRIRRIDAASLQITTVAGNGSPGFSGDGAAPTAASVSSAVTAMIVDASGNLFLADTGNNVIRKVAADMSTIATIAGTAIGGYAGDSGAATDAELNSPAGLAMDSAGNLNIADSANGRIRQVSSSTQVISTIAGGGASGDGGPAVAAQLNSPAGLAVDGNGNLYVNDCGEERIRRVSLMTGTISTFAGVGYPGFSGDSGLATQAALQGCGGIAAAGTSLYIADTQNYRVREVSPGGAIDTIAGDGQPGSLSSTVAADAAQFHPTSVASDASGNVYIADSISNRVLIYSNATGMVSLVAGNGSFDYGGDGGPAIAASLASPASVAVDVAGNVYIADTTNHRIRCVNAISHIIGTIAGTGNYAHSGDGNQAVTADIAFPTNLTFDDSGNLYFLEGTLGNVRRISASGVITTVASGLALPGGLAADPAGNLYVSETPLNRVRKLTAPSGPLQIGTVSPLPEAFVGTPYAMVMTATGGAAPYRNWTALAGTLPPGFVLNADTGVLSGSAAAAGSFEFTIAVSDSSGTRVNKIFKMTVSAPAFIIGADDIVNGASLTPGPIAPGEVIAIFGNAFGPASLTVAGPDASGLYPTTLAGVSVLFDNVPAPLLYVSSKQIGVMAPYGIASGSSTSVQIEYNGAYSNAVSETVAPLRPALFTADSSGAGQVLAINEDGSVNSADNPASPGSILILYATGFGILNPAGQDGALSSPPLGAPAGPVVITVGGVSAEVPYAGAAPSIVSGVIQINMRIPATAVSGNQSLGVSVAGATSSQKVSVSVR